MINTQYKAGYIHHMLSYKVHLMIWKNQDLRATWGKILIPNIPLWNTKLSYVLLDVCILHIC